MKRYLPTPHTRFITVFLGSYGGPATVDSRETHLRHDKDKRIPIGRISVEDYS